MEATNNSFQKIEYWLLAAVVRDTEPLHALTSREDVEFGMNLPWHGLRPDELSSSLLFLFHRGDIHIGYLEQYTLLKPEDKVTKENILSALIATPISSPDSEIALYYWLSAQGGSRWEAMVSPNWSRYLDDSICFEPDERQLKELHPELVVAFEHTHIDVGIQEYTCIDRAYIQHYYQWWTKDVGFQVVPGTERWQRITPWQATYWKTLAHGYKLQCLVTEAASETEYPHRNYEAAYEHYQWYGNPFAPSS